MCGKSVQWVLAPMVIGRGQAGMGRAGFMAMCRASLTIIGGWLAILAGPLVAIPVLSDPRRFSMSKTFRTLALIELFGAALLILLGFMLIWWPRLTLQSLVMFCGAFLLVESISAMIGAWRCYGVLRWPRGGVGALGVALALLIVLLPDLTLSFIAVAVGL